MIALFGVACGSEGDAACAGPGACAGDAETPATGKLADIDAWVSAGSFKGWKCEAAAHPPRGTSAHDANRICTNAKLAGATDLSQPAPVGAANVKELYEDGKVVGHAFMLKVTAGAGPESWYFYEKLGGGRVAANGPADSTCTGCHQAAPGDFVFTRVK